MYRVGYLYFALLLAGCAGSSAALSGSGENTTISPGEIAFIQNLYPTVVSRCGGCHATAQAPFFAIPNDTNNSYDNVKALVNLNTPTNSMLVTQVAAGHNCWSQSCASDSQELLGLIQLMANQAPSTDAPTDTTPSVILTAQTIPAGVANATTTMNTVTMTFPLVGAATGIPADANLQITIGKTDATHYELFNLSVRSSVPLSISNVSVFINGAEAAANSSFSAVDYVTSPVPASTTNYIPISPGTAIGSFGTGGPGVDTLSFGFQLLVPVSQNSAQLFQDFLSTIQTKCSNCHNVPVFVSYAGKTLPAFATFTQPSDFTSVNVSLQGIPFITPNNPLNSSIYFYTSSAAIGSSHIMPPSVYPSYDVTIATTISNWIKSLP